MKRQRLVTSSTLITALTITIHPECGYTIVVFNDNDYGLISEKQMDHTGEAFGTGLTNPDLPAFAESFGIDGYRPTTPDELREAFDAAIGSDGMSLIEVPVA